MRVHKHALTHAICEAGVCTGCQQAVCQPHMGQAASARRQPENCRWRHCQGWGGRRSSPGLGIPPRSLWGCAWRCRHCKRVAGEREGLKLGHGRQDRQHARAIDQLVMPQVQLQGGRSVWVEGAGMTRAGLCITGCCVLCPAPPHPDTCACLHECMDARAYHLRARVRTYTRAHTPLISWGIAGGGLCCQHLPACSQPPATREQRSTGARWAGSRMLERRCTGAGCSASPWTRMPACTFPRCAGGSPAARCSLGHHNTTHAETDKRRIMGPITI